MSMARRTARLAAIVTLLICFVVPSGPTVAQSHMDKLLFLELANSRDSESWGLLLVNLKGILAGLEAANMTLVRRGDDRLYCPPPDAAITPDWAANEMLAYLTRYPSIPDSMSIAVIANSTLAEIFACETGT